MNTKKIKALRKSIGYHPRQPRSYVLEKGVKYVPAKDGGLAKIDVQWIELDSRCSRYMYQQMKRELKTG